MQIKPFTKLLVACVSLGGLILVGCDQQSQSDPQATETTPQVQTSTTVTTTQTPATATTPATQTQAQNRTPDVPYVPTPQNVVDEMLELAQVKGDDVLYDLGSGDGRIVITAAQKFGTRGTGFDINPKLVQESQANAKTAGVSDKVQFVEKDLFTTDLSKATVVTLYLLPDVNLRLRPKLLKELKPGTRIVSHNYDMGEWKPERVVQVKSPTGQHTLYTWVVPETIPENLR
ncbi:class I SAM-dependent methyltransferase [Microcoleus sp. FACHB-672]|nr:class I SAM-dependent methyltransferase [Microcoleus sp. FACHB-672]